MRGVLSASPPFSRITPTTHLERGSWTAAGRGEQLVWPLSITPPQSPSIHPPIHPQRPITYNHPWAALVFTRFRLFQKTDFSALGGLGFFVRALVLHAVPCALCVCVPSRARLLLFRSILAVVVVFCPKHCLALPPAEGGGRLAASSTLLMYRGLSILLGTHIRGGASQLRPET